jgi:hypothetical protein
MTVAMTFKNVCLHVASYENGTGNLHQLLENFLFSFLETPPSNHIYICSRSERIVGADPDLDLFSSITNPALTLDPISQIVVRTCFNPLNQSTFFELFVHI